VKKKGGGGVVSKDLRPEGAQDRAVEDRVFSRVGSGVPDMDGGAYRGCCSVRRLVQVDCHQVVEAVLVHRSLSLRYRETVHAEWTLFVQNNFITTPP